MSFLAELKRRNVFRVGAAYLVASWLIILLVETIFPTFGFGDGAVRNVVIVLGAGLIPVLILAAVASGNREAANAAVTRIDQRPGGQFMLVQTTLMCFCGAPFDLEATPNFKARLQGARFNWPPPTILDFPLKDW